MRAIQEPSHNVPVVGEFDVVVLGGGPGGLPAAIAAARCGAKTILIERYGFLGGLATAGLIGPILGHRVSKEPRAAIGGIPEELCRRMADLGGAPPWEDAIQEWGVRFDVEILKLVADAMAQEAGVRLVLHTLGASVAMADGDIEAVIVESKSGRQAVAGKAFVDGTGDADLAHWAGAATTKGRPADGRPMAMGTIFRVAGVKDAPRDAVAAARDRIRAAIESGELYMYNPGTGGKGSTMQAAEVTCNVARAAGDATSVEDLTAAELKIRRETHDIVRFYRENVPGMEDCYLSATPTTIGPRETRQAVGLATLTGDDVVKGAKSPEAVARCGYWIDIHCPLGRVQNQTHLCSVKCPNDPPCIMFEEAHRAGLPDELYPPDGDWFDIPYGSLVSRDVGNLLTSGRCISADHHAMAALRVMGTCMAIGQAAGTAAALAADAGARAADVPIDKLRETLTADGQLC
ncbi:MAG: FAD-dependent oxidoreductase [Armatimonadota bacterium]